MNMFCKHKYSITNGYSTYTYDEDFCYEFTCVKCNKRIKLYTSDLQNDLSKLRDKYNESNTDNLGLFTCGHFYLFSYTGSHVTRLKQSYLKKGINLDEINSWNDANTPKKLLLRFISHFNYEVTYMTNQLKEILNELSKEQLIYLIEQYYHSQFLIGEVCVDESKQHISSEKAVKEIRSYLYDMPSTYNVDHFKAQIDLKMGKITIYEYRKTLGLD